MPGQITADAITPGATTTTPGGTTPGPTTPGATTPGATPETGTAAAPPPGAETSPSPAEPGSATPGEEGGTVPAPGATEEGAPEGEQAQTVPDEQRMRLIVIDAATFGIDPVVGRVAAARMRETGEEMGYHVLTPNETIAAAQQIRMPFPPTPADLWRVSWVAQAHRGAFARIWAESGQYVIEITVASLDGSGPFFARGRAGADDLRRVVDQLLRTALPPPNAWSPASATSTATQPRVSALEPQEQEYIDELDEDAMRFARRR